MTGMFYAALKFNQNIGNWDVGKVTDMSYMFKHAQSFNFDLSSWKGPAVEATAHEIFEDAQNFLESFPRAQACLFTGQWLLATGLKPASRIV